LGDNVQPFHGITTILFDLDGTLRHNRPSSVQFFLDYAVSLGVEDGWNKRMAAIRWTHWYWAQSEEMLQDLQDYPDQDPFWIHYAEKFLEVFGCAREQARSLGANVHHHMIEHHQPENWVPSDVPETSEELSNQGYKLGVVSNRTHSCHDELRQLGLAKYFELALVAGEVDTWKPEPEIFYHALDRLGVSHPHQAVYLGDNYYADVIGSRRAGLRAVLIDPEGVFPNADCPVVGDLSEFRCFFP
jgi:FMN phosphatase YigB (HAD superfamily)